MMRTIAMTFLIREYWQIFDILKMSEEIVINIKDN